mgnify:FL=1
MYDRAINIGNKSFVIYDQINVVIAADADKVRRLFIKWKIDRDSPKVVNLTSDKETRSLIILKDGMCVLSSVNSTVLQKRINGGSAEN